jgi:polysaccharide chain length determinant protein (PEP-CTERM system associated)
MNDITRQLLYYASAAWRKRWWGMAFAWLVAIAGWAVVFTMPDRYEAYARVYVDTQSVLRPLLAGVAVQPNIDQLVSMMSRTLISRPNLEKVLRMADLDIRVKTPEDRERLVNSLSRTLDLKSAGRENLYTISYSDRNPQDAKKVVQALLTLFIEGSLGDKRKDSDTARRFLDEQLKVYSEKLTTAENAVTEFKRRYIGLLPGEGQSFYTRIGEGQSALNQARLELKEAENGRDALRRQLVLDQPPALLDERSVVDAPNPEIDARIQSLQQRLDSLRMNFTDQHPDITSITRMIEQLREQKQREAKLRKPPPAARSSPNSLMDQLSVSVAEAEANVASLRARVSEYERRFNELKAAANALPQVEAEYKQLTRDYEVTKSNYEKLLSRRESAQISGDMESNASGVDFRVVDPPVVPSVPNWPNRPLFMSLVLLAALVGGVAFSTLISQLRPTVDDEKRLREVSGLTVIGSVWIARTAEMRAGHKKRLLALLASFLSLLSAYGAIMLVLFVASAKA